MPKRIQRKRTRGWRLPKNTICVDRTSRWGNPFKVQESPWGWHVVQGGIHTGAFGNKTEATNVALQRYRHYLRGRLTANPEFLEPLRGKDLACFCKESEPCHADILLAMCAEMEGDTWLEHMTAHAPDPEPEPPDDWPDEPDEDLLHYDTPGGW